MAIIFFVMAFFLGMAAHKMAFCAHSIGSLRVDTSIPNEEPYLFLELQKSIESIQAKKYVVLKVDLHNYISLK